MIQPPEYLDDVEADQWIRRWASIFWTLDGLFSFSDQINDNTEDGHVDPVFNLIAAVPNIGALNQGNRPLFAVPQGDNSISATLRIIAKDMLIFAAQQFAFVLDTFHRNHVFQLNLDDASFRMPFNQWRLRQFIAEEFSHAAVYPTHADLSRYSLRRVVSQFGNDVLTLHQIWTQETTFCKISTATITRNRKTLSMLAKNVHEHFASNTPATEPPLVYLRSHAGARLVPASHRPLIAVPASALLDTQESLAIPHEFAHFLFWRGESRLPDCNGQLLQDRLDLKMQELTDIHPIVNYDWREEIFSDVVGTLFGGPLVVDSLLKMLMEKGRFALCQHSGHHPLPIVRPYAALHVLRRIADVAGGTIDSNIVDKLESKWCNYVGDVDCVRIDSLFSVAADNTDPNASSEAEPPITIERLRKDLEAVADCVIEILTDEGYKLSDFAARWYDADDTNTAIAKLEEEGVVPSSSLPAPRSGPQLPKTWVEIVQSGLSLSSKNADKFGVDRFGELSWVTPILDTATQVGVDSFQNRITLTPEDWMSILALGGWGDAGPTGGSPHVT